ncbi:MAG: copper resistance protein CopC [Gammaproteobacteria bacterium]|jgi:copper resistance protein C
MQHGIRRIQYVVGLCAALLLPAAAVAHAFPERSVPRVGATVSSAPKRVRIWFDGNLNVLFSKVTVTGPDGERVSKGHGHVSATNPRLLEVVLKPLRPGQYWVHWSVVARDGHHTEGKYPFTVN